MFYVLELGDSFTFLSAAPPTTRIDAGRTGRLARTRNVSNNLSTLQHTFRPRQKYWLVASPKKHQSEIGYNLVCHN